VPRRRKLKLRHYPEMGWFSGSILIILLLASIAFNSSAATFDLSTRLFDSVFAARSLASSANLWNRALSGISTASPTTRSSPQLRFNFPLRFSSLGHFPYSKISSPTTPKSTTIPPGSLINAQIQPRTEDAALRREIVHVWNLRIIMISLFVLAAARFYKIWRK